MPDLTRILPARFATLLLVTSCTQVYPQETGPMQWLAGDHHIHSRYSVGLQPDTDPPVPIIGGDAIYPIPFNNLMARHYGLTWVVATDHGGPNHSKVNYDLAYPELLLAREALPDMIQFYGMELNSPGADHSTLIIPHTPDERERLFEIESRFDARDAWPTDPTRNEEGKMLEALRLMDGLAAKPLVIANHPSRSAQGLGVYGLTTPAELRNWNDTAPDVAVGMAGAPGRQAMGLTGRPRGAYGGYPTLGGFDQLTARLGGFWDSMLGEGRHWWITANSDSHIHHSEGGNDFRPGEFSKTYLYAEKSYDGVLDALRHGRIFVTTGDLISELYVSVQSGSAEAAIGGELVLDEPGEVTVAIMLRDPAGVNNNGNNPVVSRVDLIAGDILGPVADGATDTNPTTRVIARFTENDWVRNGEMLAMRQTLTVTGPMYLRVRGTNTADLEPTPDPLGQNPWDVLWFYSNPVFIGIDD